MLDLLVFTRTKPLLSCFCLILSCHIFQTADASISAQSGDSGRGIKLAGGFNETETADGCPLAGPIRCYVCSYSADEEQYGYQDENFECVSSTNKQTIDASAPSYVCPHPSLRFCRAEALYQNNVFVSVHRFCSTSCENNECSFQGYGITRKTCISCCDWDLCNDWGNETFYSGASFTELRSIDNINALDGAPGSLVNDSLEMEALHNGGI